VNIRRKTPVLGPLCIVVLFGKSFGGSNSLPEDMSRDAGWLDVVATGSDGLIVGDRGQLTRISKELRDPANQYPVFLLFLGQKTKEQALSAVFSSNNIRRTRSEATVSLRVEVGTENSSVPVLFADSNPFSTVRQRSDGCKNDYAGTYPITWTEPKDVDTLCFLYSRVILLFSNVVCIFADDFSSLRSMADLLERIARAGNSASTLTPGIRPAVLVIYNHAPTDEALHGGGILSPDSASFADSFSSIETVILDSGNKKLLIPTRYERLKRTLRRHIDRTCATRAGYRARYSACHSEALFRAALKHTATTLDVPFDHLREMRSGNAVSAELSDRWATYFRLGVQAGVQVENLIPSIASAIVVDNYPPRMHCVYNQRHLHLHVTNPTQCLIR
jgi:hypothetical protein